MNNTVTLQMTREEAVRVLAMLAGTMPISTHPWPVEPATLQDIKNDFAAELPKQPEHQIISKEEAVSGTPDEPQDYQAPTDTPPPPADDLVDINGTPWDERIHSGGKSKMANGQWTRRRGVTPALYDMVMAELTGAPADPAPVTPPAPPAPVTPPPPPATVEEPPFVALQKKVQAWIASAVDVPQRSERAQALGKALKDYGVVSLPALANQPELIPAIEMALAL